MPEIKISLNVVEIEEFNRLIQSLRNLLKSIQCGELVVSSDIAERLDDLLSDWENDLK